MRARRRPRWRRCAAPHAIVAIRTRTRRTEAPRRLLQRAAKRGRRVLRKLGVMRRPSAMRALPHAARATRALRTTRTTRMKRMTRTSRMPRRLDGMRRSDAMRASQAGATAGEPGAMRMLPHTAHAMRALRIRATTGTMAVLRRSEMLRRTLLSPEADAAPSSCARYDAAVRAV